MIALLRILEPFRIPQTGGFKNPLNVHRFIESMKFAFGARSEVTDPAFVKDADRLDRFWKTGWPDEVRDKITDVSNVNVAVLLDFTDQQDSTHKIGYYGMKFDQIEDHGTTHLSVVDKWGGVASVTSTVCRTCGTL